MKSNRFHFPSALSWSRVALLFLLMPLAAAAVYPVRFGDVKSVFGENEKDLSFTFSHPKARQFEPFAEKTGGAHPKESCFGSACFDKAGFNICFFVKGDPKAAIGDCGGSVSLDIRPGMVNCPTSGAPIMVDYSLEKFPARPPAKPMFVPVNNENGVIYCDPVRFSYPMPSTGNMNVRIQQPTVNFYSLENGWALVFSFRWVDSQERLPFVEGRYPVSWRLIATRTRDDGTIASWGSLAEPVILSWGRPGDSLIDDIEMNFFLNDGLGPAYRSDSGFVRGYWSIYQTEKWMYYLDPGRPTFETKNPESDEMFFKRIVTPILDSNANIDKAIFYSYKANIPVPPVKSYSKAERRAIVSGLDRVIFTKEIIDNARRDYLLARFFDEPVPMRTVPKAAKPKKLKKLDMNREMSADDLNLDGGFGDDVIELDDIDF